MITGVDLLCATAMAVLVIFAIESAHALGKAKGRSQALGDSSASKLKGILNAGAIASSEDSGGNDTRRQGATLPDPHEAGRANPAAPGYPFHAGGMAPTPRYGYPFARRRGNA